MRSRRHAQAKGDREQLEWILRAIYKERRPLDGTNVATILQSAAKFPGVLTSSMVRYLIRTLRMEKTTLNGRALGNAIYGLQATPSQGEVRELIAALTPKVAQCTDSRLDPGSIRSALAGFRNLPASPELRMLMDVLAPLIQNPDEPGSKVRMHARTEPYSRVDLRVRVE